MKQIFFQLLSYTQIQASKAEYLSTTHWNFCVSVAWRMCSDNAFTYCIMVDGCCLLLTLCRVHQAHHTLVSSQTILTKVSFFFPFLNFNFILRGAPATGSKPRRALHSSDLLRIVLACFSTWVRWERNSPNLLSPTAFDNWERLSSFPSASCLHMRTRIVSSCSSESGTSPSFGVGAALSLRASGRGE